MKIDISDKLYYDLRIFLQKRNFLNQKQDIAKHIEGLIKIELVKFCEPDYEKDSLTKCMTYAKLSSFIYDSLFGDGWDDNSIYRKVFLCLDIDNFKKYIDREGMESGNDVLYSIACNLRNSLSGMTIYRHGGDEFVVPVNSIVAFPSEISNSVKLKYSWVKVSVKRNHKIRTHLLNWILFHINEGMIAASEQGTIIDCIYPIH